MMTIKKQLQKWIAQFNITIETDSAKMMHELPTVGNRQCSEATSCKTKTFQRSYKGKRLPMIRRLYSRLKYANKV